MDQDTKDEANARDSASLRIIGWFFSALAVLVLIGTMWTEKPRETVVTVCSACMLGVAGAGMIYMSRRLTRGKA